MTWNGIPTGLNDMARIKVKKMRGQITVESRGALIRYAKTRSLGIIANR